MASNTSGETDYKLYRYTPSLVAAILFTVLFMLATCYHLYQVVRTRAWYFIVFVIGGACKLAQSHCRGLPVPSWSLRESTALLTNGTVQIIGYICRALGHNDKENIPLYSISTTMILLAPPLYAASIYMTLGRLIVNLDAEKLSLVPVKWLTIIFVAGDVIAFLMQAAGN